MTPYVRGIMDTLDDPTIERVVLCAGAQTGKTLTAYAWLAHAIACDPGPALVVYPADDLARSASQTRIMPLFEDSPVLASLLPANRKDFWTTSQYRLPTCVVNLVGSNSPSQLASRPVRYLLADEVDKWPRQTAAEADPVNLAMQRTKTFWNRKVLMVSTPTTPDGAISRYAEAGDMRRYYLPCPHCREMQPLEWPRVKFDSSLEAHSAADGAYYECRACAKPWSDLQKVAALASGQWRPTKPASERCVASFHLSSLYAPWVTWGQLVAKFLRTKANPVELMDFVNSELAEPFAQIDLRFADSILADREGDYREGERFASAPAYSRRYDDHDRRPVVFGGVDVQQTCMFVVLREFTATGDSGQVWHGMISTFAELAGLMEKYTVEAISVDCRYRQADVYSAAQAYPGIWPAVGVGPFRVPAIFEMQTRYPDEGRRRGGMSPVQVVTFDSDAVHDLLSERMRAEAQAPAWYIPRGASRDAEYHRQMIAQVRANGRWLNPQKRPDHYWDAEALALLTAWVSGYRP